MSSAWQNEIPHNNTLKVQAALGVNWPDAVMASNLLDALDRSGFGNGLNMLESIRLEMGGGDTLDHALLHLLIGGLPSIVRYGAQMAMADMMEKL